MGRPIKKTAYRQMFDGRKLNTLINKCMSAYELVNLYNTFITTAEEERNARLLNNSDINKQLDKFIAKAKEDINADANIMDIVQLKELIAKATVKQAELERQGRGGVQASKTRKTNKEKRMYSDWIELPIHGMSVNYMYDVKCNRKVKSTAYEMWIKQFPTHLIPHIWSLHKDYGIKAQKEIGIEMEFICKEGFDVDNLTKSFIDIFVKTLGLRDDNKVVETVARKIGTCEEFDEGIIRFRVYNI